MQDDPQSDYKKTAVNSSGTFAGSTTFTAADTNTSSDPAAIVAANSAAMAAVAADIDAAEAAAQGGGGATAELSCIALYFYRGFRRAVKLLREMNYVVVLLSFTALSCLLFALIIFAMQPPTRTGRIFYNGTIVALQNVSIVRQLANLTNTTNLITDEKQPIKFLDALFMSVSAFTASGLNTVDYTSWSAGELAFVAFVVSFGSIVLLTTLPAFLRYRALTKERWKLLHVLESTGAYGPPAVAPFSLAGESQVNFAATAAQQIVKQEQHQQRKASTAADVMSPCDEALSPPPPSSAADSNNNSNQNDEAAQSLLANQQPLPSSSNNNGSSASPLALGSPSQADINRKLNRGARERASTIIYGNGNNDVSGQASPTVDSLASPVAAAGDWYASLSLGQRLVYEDGLAHVNQQIDICLIIIFCAFTYFFVTHLLFTILIVAAGDYGFGWALFHVISAFNNAGFSYSSDSMMPISTNIYLMICFTLLMPLGNSFFPLSMRVMVSLLHWTLEKMTGTKLQQQQGQQQQQSNSTNDKEQQLIGGSSNNSTTDAASQQPPPQPPRSFLGQPLIVWQHSVWLFLRYPRRYYTHMFSTRTSLILFGVWMFLTIVGALLLIPELRDDACVAAGVEAKHKFWIALFQTVAVRTTGYSIINLDKVSPAHLAYWILAMYVAAYPFLLAVRSSSVSRTSGKNTVEAAAKLTVSSDDDDDDSDDDKNPTDQASDDKKQSGNNDKKNNRSKKQQKNAASNQGNVNGGNNDDNVTESDSSGGDDDDDDIDAEETDATLYQQTMRSRKSVSARDAAKARAIAAHQRKLGRDAAGAFVRREATSVMARDLLWLYIALLVILYAEQENGHTAQHLGEAFSIYLRTAFEITSAFGNVGLSLGAADTGASFSGTFKNGASVFVVILVMYFGKHRNLPQSVDDAIAIRCREYEFTGDLNPDAAVDLSRTGSMMSETARQRYDAKRQRKHRRFVERVRRFYLHYNPARLAQLDRIVAAFQSNPKALIANLAATYGLEPPRGKKN